MASKSTFFLLLIAILASGPASAAEVKLAVASNFHSTTEQLAAAFEKATGHEMKISYGSTGKLYAQIVHGAPFDVFMAADQWRAERLENEGLAESGTRFTYAEGRLALWSPDPSAFEDPEKFLTSESERRLAIANPATAPYGLAAQQVLEKMGLWEELAPSLVRGESIAQTFQFAATRNARGAFIALAQLIPMQQKGSVWLVPRQMHDPIAQQAVLLKRGSDNPAAIAWLEFLKSPEVREIINGQGYDIAETP